MDYYFRDPNELYPLLADKVLSTSIDGSNHFRFTGGQQECARANTPPTAGPGVAHPPVKTAAVVRRPSTHDHHARLRWVAGATTGSPLSVSSAVASAAVRVDHDVVAVGVTEEDGVAGVVPDGRAGVAPVALGVSVGPAPGEQGDGRRRRERQALERVAVAGRLVGDDPAVEVDRRRPGVREPHPLVVQVVVVVTGRVVPDVDLDRDLDGRRAACLGSPHAGSVCDGLVLQRVVPVVAGGVGLVAT
jgi:hypothetical protein